MKATGKAKRTKQGPDGLVIARRIRQLRLDRGWGQQEVAARARAWGLDWTPNTLKNVEAGERSVAFAEFFVLLLVFETTEAEFFVGENLPLTPRLEVEPGGLSEILRKGRLVEWDPEEIQALRLEEQAQAERAAADEHAAQVLGIDPLELKMIARRRWGRSIARERDGRLEARGVPVDPRSKQAIRGHITRTLLEELRDAGVGGKSTTKRGKR